MIFGLFDYFRHLLDGNENLIPDRPGHMFTALDETGWFHLNEQISSMGHRILVEYLNFASQIF